MKFLMHHKPDASTEAGTPPSPEMMERMGVFMDEMVRSGKLVVGEGCMPSKYAVKISRHDGQTTVIDGPFTETKELVSGYAVVEVASKEEAIELSKRFFEVIGEGEGYIQQIQEWEGPRS